MSEVADTRSVFPPGFSPINVAIGATFALDSIEESLSIVLNKFVGLPVSLSWIPYGTSLSSVLCEPCASSLRVLLVRVIDLQGHPEERRQVLTKKRQAASLPQGKARKTTIMNVTFFIYLGTPLETITACYAELLNLLKASTSTPTVLLLMPLPPFELLPDERTVALQKLEQEFVEQVRSHFFLPLLLSPLSSPSLTPHCQARGCRNVAVLLSSEEVHALMTSPLS